MRYNWRYIKTKTQECYEAAVGKDTLCVFRDRRGHNSPWMGMIEKDDSPLLIYKVSSKNCNARPKDVEAKAHRLFSAADPERMKRNVEHCYEAGTREIYG